MGAPQKPHTEGTLFPYSWDRPVNPGYLHECGECGAAVSELDRHVRWHNLLIRTTGVILEPDRLED